MTSITDGASNKIMITDDVVIAGPGFAATSGPLSAALANDRTFEFDIDYADGVLVAAGDGTGDGWIAPIDVLLSSYQTGAVVIGPPTGEREIADDAGAAPLHRDSDEMQIWLAPFIHDDGF